MQNSIELRLARSKRGRLVAASVMTAVLATGCGEGSPGKTSPSAGRATTAGSSVASARTATTHGSNSATGAGTTSSRPAATGAGPPGALAFAECMRSSGVPDFPDPQPGGGFAFHTSPGVASSPAFKTAQAKCQRYIPGGGPLSPGAPPSAQTMAQLRQVAQCMRQHGVAQFPDPRSTPPPGASANLDAYSMITNYKGAILLFPKTIDMQSPAYQQAAAACGAGFLGGQHSH